MLLELSLGILGNALYGANKAMKLDEKTIQKYGKAFEKKETAAVKLRKKIEYADKRLINVANKKRAIIQVTYPKFVEVYKRIQKIEIEKSERSDESRFFLAIDNFSKSNQIQVIAPEAITDKQLVCGLIFRGLGKTMINESERKLSAAKRTMSEANVYKSHMESMEVIYDAIAERADRIARLMIGMNIVFLRAIATTDEIIKKNGTNLRNYSEFEKGVLMTLVNIADAMSECIGLPVIDEKGQLYEAAVEMIQKNEEFLQKMNSLGL